jgi:hypothetical protein
VGGILKGDIWVSLPLPERRDLLRDPDRLGGIGVRIGC